MSLVNSGCGRGVFGRGKSELARNAWVLIIVATALQLRAGEMPVVSVGFGKADITPELGPDRPVYLAGYSPGRTAQDVHDPLWSRCLVIAVENARLAVVSVDSIGLQLPTVEQIRQKLTDYRYVLVSSTHNHEAPDTIGLWGPTPLVSGVDPRYLERIVEQTVTAVRQAEQRLVPVTARFGTAEDDSLLSDSRLPVVKDGILRLVKFERVDNHQPVGIWMQWNCHPEALGSRNRSITADFPWATITSLEQTEGCPVVYMTGAVGGLMAPPRGVVKDPQGNLLPESTFAYAERYGQMVADLARKALASCRTVRLGPLQVAAVPVHVPVTNPWYRAARAAGILKRSSYQWSGDPFMPGEPLGWYNAWKTMAVRSEVAVVRLGELSIACIPGEIYPELVYGRFEDPPDAGADYPDAPLEPTVVQLLGDGPWLLAGLANDELGYLIPKRQWDAEPPFCYGRSQGQYGEINSCGPDAANAVMQALARCLKQLNSNVPVPAAGP
ncbi:MAG: hypothetical protein KatS3mg110_1228 [Pirellulaceae bacterium]|nr:MAG: hypothetical protein KatS3mg110_1228 [Pirellulaceae bacterium]